MIPDLQALTKQLDEHFSNIDTTIQSLGGYTSNEEIDYLRAQLLLTKRLIAVHVAQANDRCSVS